MSGIVIYGSLLNREQWKRQGFEEKRITPVKINSFKRNFDQEPSWRKGKGAMRAVLSVSPSVGYWFNGLIFHQLTEKDFSELDIREKGYFRKKIDETQISVYDQYDRVCGEDIFVYVGRSKNKNEKIFPNMSYLKICIEGARQWGEAFYEDFLDTTFIGKNILLKHFLVENPIGLDFS